MNSQEVSTERFPFLGNDENNFPDESCAYYRTQCVDKQGETCERKKGLRKDSPHSFSFASSDYKSIDLHRSGVGSRLSPSRARDTETLMREYALQIFKNFFFRMCARERQLFDKKIARRVKHLSFTKGKLLIRFQNKKIAQNFGDF